MLHSSSFSLSESQGCAWKKRKQHYIKRNFNMGKAALFKDVVKQNQTLKYISNDLYSPSCKVLEDSGRASARDRIFPGFKVTSEATSAI